MRTLTAPLVAAWLGIAGLTVSSVALVAPAEAQQAGESEDLQILLRLTAIKMRRDVMAVLTPEQREKEKTEHDKVMHQHKGGGMGHGNPHGGVMPHGANPHSKNPHAGYGEAVPPSPPSNMSVQ